MPDLAEKLAELRILLAERQELHRKLMETDPLIGLIAAAHRDRATLDDHQARILPDDPAPSLAPICAELGLSPGEDVGAIVAAIRAVRERAMEIVKEQLSTPEGVHINMLRATIARLTWDQCIHLHPVAYAQAVSEAVAKEREACAALCHDYAAACFANSMQMALRVAGDAIRARSRGGEG